MQKLNKDTIRQAVREAYRNVARSDEVSGCCGTAPFLEAIPSPYSTSSTSCCDAGARPNRSLEDISVNLGYSSDEMTWVPEGANMGLGCGNPQAIANLKPGETVLDLGSGGGFDCFLAARAVRAIGHVIGVDMTPEMISKARENLLKIGFENVEFRLGEIENLPVADNTVDVIISNCVINLSPEKQRVFQEAFRVLKPRGRLAISDIVATADLPADAKKDLALYTKCISGASLVGEVEIMLERAGFTDIQIRPKDESKEFIRNWVPGQKIEDFIVSATIEAVKP